MGFESGDNGGHLGTTAWAKTISAQDCGRACGRIANVNERLGDFLDCVQVCPSLGDGNCLYRSNI